MQRAKIGHAERELRGSIEWYVRVVRRALCRERRYLVLTSVTAVSGMKRLPTTYCRPLAVDCTPVTVPRTAVV